MMFRKWSDEFNSQLYTINIANIVDLNQPKPTWNAYIRIIEYRQVAPVFVKKHLKYHGDDDINLFLDAQAGHSKCIVETEYTISTEDHR
jgi:hypothetical protein